MNENESTTTAPEAAPEAPPVPESSPPPAPPAAAPSPPRPTIGRIMFYVLPQGPFATDVRPAIVTSTEGELVTLRVFTQHAEDGPEVVRGVALGTAPGRCFWPPRA